MPYDTGVASLALYDGFWRGPVMQRVCPTMWRLRGDRVREDEKTKKECESFIADSCGGKKQSPGIKHCNKKMASCW